MTIFPNGMIYVGYTQLNIETKKFKNYYGSGNKEFKEAKRLYKKQLRKEILCVIYKDGIKTDKQLFKFLEKMETVFKVKTNCLNSEIGYNKAKFADLRTKGEGNVAKTIEFKKLISGKTKQRFVTEQTRRKMSKASKGRKQSKEWIKKKTDSFNETKQTETYKKNKFEASQKIKGVKKSEETRNKMSESAKGRIPWNKGKKFIEEKYKVGGRSNKGRKRL